MRGALEMRRVELAQILEEAVARGASDVHLSAGRPATWRLPTGLVVSEGPPLSAAEVEEMLTASLPAGRQLMPPHGDWSVGLPGVGRFRIHAFRQRGSWAAAIRVIPDRIPRREELGLPPVTEEWIAQRRGLVVIAGDRGSGRTTTLACLVDSINRSQPRHVVVIEDPIEYLHRHQRGLVNQRELGTDVASVQQALQGALRADVDVLALGLPLEPEDLSLVLRASEHCLVLTIASGRSVTEVVGWLLGSAGEWRRRMLARSLVGIIVQALVPRADGRGRVLASEVLVVTEVVRKILEEGRDHQLVPAMEAGGRWGMRTMQMHLEELRQQGVIQ